MKFNWITAILCALLASAASAQEPAKPQPKSLQQLVEETRPSALSIQQLSDLAGTSACAPYKANPVITLGAKGEWDAGALGSMSVFKVGDLLLLYYEAWGVRGDKSSDYLSLQIGHAVSLDGIHWVKDPANPVIRKSDAWDRDGTWDPFLIHEDGLFKMWYGGGENTHCDWGYAVSKDGTHFTKQGQISHLGNVEDDHVVHDTVAGRYYMYYWDRAREPKGLCRAESKNETDFDFAHAVGLKIEGESYPGMYKFTHVFKEDDGWYMLYSDFVRPNCPKSTVRLAKSADGLVWKSINRNLFPGHDGEIIKLAADLHLIYYGPQGYFDAAKCDIRVAIYKGSLAKLAAGDEGSHR